jgi:hypothetical protein
MARAAWPVRPRKPLYGPPPIHMPTYPHTHTQVADLQDNVLLGFTADGLTQLGWVVVVVGCRAAGDTLPLRVRTRVLLLQRDTPWGPASALGAAAAPLLPIATIADLACPGNGSAGCRG